MNLSWNEEIAQQAVRVRLNELAEGMTKLSYTVEKFEDCFDDDEVLDLIGLYEELQERYNEMEL